jgi:hypothetical protein
MAERIAAAQFINAETMREHSGGPVGGVRPRFEPIDELLEDGLEWHRRRRGGRG